MLNTRKTEHVPLLTDLNGNFDRNISFEIESGVIVEASCGVQYKGDFYIYGGTFRTSDSRQIAKVIDCSLKRIGTLPFELYVGACAATSEQVFLCFDLQVCKVLVKPGKKFSVCGSLRSLRRSLRRSL